MRKPVLVTGSMGVTPTSADPNRSYMFTLPPMNTIPTDPQDLTEILSKYCDWDQSTREEIIRHAALLIEKYGDILYGNERYHHWEDLKVDLEADCEPKDHNS